MKKRIQTFEELVTEASSYLRQLSYSELSVSRFESVWKDIRLYMKKRSIMEYNGNVGTRYLLQRNGNVEYKLLCRREKRYIRAVSVLSDFQQSGSFRKKIKPVEGAPLKGKIGKLISEYVDYIKYDCQLSKQTIRSSQRMLSVFLRYLNTRKMYSLKDLSNAVLFDFIKSLQSYSIESRKSIVQKARQFLHHLYKNKKIEIDFKPVLSSLRFAKHRRLPSCYSDDEIKRLIKSIDNANPIGKRGYAMVLLAAKLGLRSSDIIRLKFTELDWEKELIILEQKKTKQRLELPLLPQVGEAIIDYIKYGRPQSELPYVFLCHKNPCSEMNLSNFNGFLKSYLLRAGIKFDERHHGPHALRHSLASNLLQKKIILPVISGILGHASSQSTMCYLKVDITSLRECALEIPSKKS